MDLANTLVRTVVRAFYETRHILVVDALFIHSVYVTGYGIKKIPAKGLALIDFDIQASRRGPCVSPGHAAKRSPQALRQIT